VKVVGTEEMRALEREANASGNTYADMMEMAGTHVSRVAEDMVRHLTTGLIVVLVGPGNNGGDGLVAARKLLARGFQVRVYCTTARGDDDDNWARLQQMGVRYRTATEKGSLAALTGWLRDASLVIDALLGTGARPPVRGSVANVLATVASVVRERRETRRCLVAPTVARCESTGPLVLAVDLPSGLDADSGQVDEHTLSADVTVTMGYPKMGHFAMPGAAHVGRLVVCDIGLRTVRAGEGDIDLLVGEELRGVLPPRPIDGHKGMFGSAMVIAGSANYVGAALLAASGAARSGCGLVTLASVGRVVSCADSLIPEATRLVLPEEDGVIDSGGAAIVCRWLPRYDALAIGPGMTQEKAVQRFFEELLAGAEERRHRIGFVVGNQEDKEEALGNEGCRLPPTVVDADGLNVLAQNRRLVESLPASCVLTPHPGEMARLLDTSTDEVQANRIETARTATRTWGQVVVLKGAFTVVAEPEGRVSLAPFANPALASAGTGDVLCGVIASMLAQGLSAYDAARCGVYLHGLAGEIARQELGDTGAVASDLLTRLPRAIALVRGATERT